jgi:hypothetical protein
MNNGASAPEGMQPFASRGALSFPIRFFLREAINSPHPH